MVINHVAFPDMVWVKERPSWGTARRTRRGQKPELIVLPTQAPEESTAALKVLLDALSGLGEADLNLMAAVARVVGARGAHPGATAMWNALSPSAVRTFRRAPMVRCLPFLQETGALDCAHLGVVEARTGTDWVHRALTGRDWGLGRAAVRSSMACMALFFGAAPPAWARSLA